MDYLDPIQRQLLALSSPDHTEAGQCMSRAARNHARAILGQTLTMHMQSQAAFSPHELIQRHGKLPTNQASMLSMAGIAVGRGSPSEERV